MGRSGDPGPRAPQAAPKLAKDAAAAVLAAGCSFAGPAVLSANAITSEVRNQLSRAPASGKARNSLMTEAPPGTV